MRLPLLILCALAVRAAAEPSLPRVVTAPTAWLPGAGNAIGSATLDHRGDGSIELGYGLGELAGVELGADTDDRTCDPRACTPHWLPRAQLRIGAPEDAVFRGQPAIVLGASKTIGDARQVAELYAVASRQIWIDTGPAKPDLSIIRIHAGVTAIAATGMPARLRPIGGLELTPPQYPKTSLVADLAWRARFSPQPEWVIGWGVRYQALSWGSIELDVRHREGEGLAASTVMVRVNGSLRGLP